MKIKRRHIALALLAALLVCVSIMSEAHHYGRAKALREGLHDTVQGGRCTTENIGKTKGCRIYGGWATAGMAAAAAEWVGGNTICCGSFSGGGPGVAPPECPSPHLPLRIITIGGEGVGTPGDTGSVPDASTIIGWCKTLNYNGVGFDMEGALQGDGSTANFVNNLMGELKAQWKADPETTGDLHTQATVFGSTDYAKVQGGTNGGWSNADTIALMLYGLKMNGQAWGITKDASAHAGACGTGCGVCGETWPYIYQWIQDKELKCVHKLVLGATAYQEGCLTSQMLTFFKKLVEHYGMAGILLWPGNLATPPTSCWLKNGWDGPTTDCDSGSGTCPPYQPPTWCGGSGGPPPTPTGNNAASGNASVGGGTNVCGKNWADAIAQCKAGTQVLCPGGTDAPCPPGTGCKAGVPCASSPSPSHNVNPPVNPAHQTPRPSTPTSGGTPTKGGGSSWFAPCASAGGQCLTGGAWKCPGGPGDSLGYKDECGGQLCCKK